MVHSPRAYSSKAQLEAGRSYAASRGWTVVGEHVDDGVSATSNRPEDRAGWRAVLAEREQYDAVVIGKVDRLARRVLDSERPGFYMYARRLNAPWARLSGGKVALASAAHVPGGAARFPGAVPEVGLSVATTNGHHVAVFGDCLALLIQQPKRVVQYCIPGRPKRGSLLITDPSARLPPLPDRDVQLAAANAS